MPVRKDQLPLYPAIDRLYRALGHAITMSDRLIERTERLLTERPDGWPRWMGYSPPNEAAEYKDIGHGKAIQQGRCYIDLQDLEAELSQLPERVRSGRPTDSDLASMSEDLRYALKRHGSVEAYARALEQTHLKSYGSTADVLDTFYVVHRKYFEALDDASEALGEATPTLDGDAKRPILERPSGVIAGALNLMRQALPSPDWLGFPVVPRPQWVTNLKAASQAVEAARDEYGKITRVTVSATATVEKEGMEDAPPSDSTPPRQSIALQRTQLLLRTRHLRKRHRKEVHRAVRRFAHWLRARVAAMIETQREATRLEVALIPLAYDVALEARQRRRKLRGRSTFNPWKLAEERGVSMKEVAPALNFEGCSIGKPIPEYVHRAYLALGRWDHHTAFKLKWMVSLLLAAATGKWHVPDQDVVHRVPQRIELSEWKPRAAYIHAKRFVEQFGKLSVREVQTLLNPRRKFPRPPIEGRLLERVQELKTESAEEEKGVIDIPSTAGFWDRLVILSMYLDADFRPGRSMKNAPRWAGTGSDGLLKSGVVAAKRDLAQQGGPDTDAWAWELLERTVMTLEGLRAVRPHPDTSKQFKTRIQRKGAGNRKRASGQSQGMKERVPSAFAPSPTQAHSNAGGSEPNKPKSVPPVDVSLVLRKRDQGPLVCGVEKDVLTDARYNVLETVILFGAKGLSKNDLKTKSGHGDAVNVLKVLSRIDQHWSAAIPLPRKRGARYRVINGRVEAKKPS